MHIKEEAWFLKECVYKLYNHDMIVYYFNNPCSKFYFTPAKIIEIFEGWGFSCEYIDSNGWEQDTQYRLSHEKIQLILSYSGHYFTMNLRLEGEEEEE